MKNVGRVLLKGKIKEWDKYYNLIIFGLILNSFSIDFTNVPVRILINIIGLAMLVYAFYGVSFLNDELKKAFSFMMVSREIYLFSIILASLPVSQNIYIVYIIKAVHEIIFIVSFVYAAIGISKLCKNSKNENQVFLYLAKSAAAVVVGEFFWIAIEYTGVQDFIIVWMLFILLAVYLFIINCFIHVKETLIREKVRAVEISKGRIFTVLGTNCVAVIAICCIAGIAFEQNGYNSEVAAMYEYADAETVRAKMISAGFPADIANELKDDEIMYYENIQKTSVHTEYQTIDGASISMNCCYSLVGEEDGKQVIRVLVYYSWKDNPDHCYDEVIKIIPDTKGTIVADEEGNLINGSMIYTTDSDETKFALFEVSSEVEKSSTNYYLVFKYDKTSSDRAGYFAYTFLADESADTVSSTICYYHRSDFFNIPYKTPIEYMEHDSSDSKFYKEKCFMFSTVDFRIFE